LSVHVVTGGGGFIGSHIVHALVERGETVVVLDNFSTGKRSNLSECQTSVDIREVDLATAEDLPGHFAGVDTVFHQAAIPSVPRSVSEPVACHEANLTATLKVLDACRLTGVRRVVYASSSAVYGDNPSLPKREETSPEPVSPYGAQKYFGEVYARLFWNSFELETVSLRYFNVFGPRQDPSSAYSGLFARFVPALLRGESPTIYGDGEQSRDFVYVSDVVRANLCAASVEGVGGEVFNVATGEAVTVNSVLETTQQVTGRMLAPRHEPRRAGDILHSRADISRAREILDWTPRVGLREGLGLTVDWYRENMEEVASDE
jgi:nucleoside-diphosphate-sugar epimerase